MHAEASYHHSRPFTLARQAISRPVTSRTFPSLLYTPLSPLHCRAGRAPNTRQSGQCSTAALDRRHGTAREPRGRPYAHLGRIQSPHGEISSHIDRIQAPHAPGGTPTCTPRHRRRAGSHVMRCSRRGAVARLHRARVAAATGQTTLRPADAGTTTGLRLA